jgi:hypothetical protein
VSDLIFEKQSGPTPWWMVLDTTTGQAVGSVEWHDHLGRFGFAAEDQDAAVFVDPIAAYQMRTFLRGLLGTAMEE